MSVEEMRRLIEQAAVDRNLMHRLRQDPDLALTAFDLTMTEIVALKAHDAAVLRAMGLDAASADRWEALWGT